MFDQATADDIRGCFFIHSVEHFSPFYGVCDGLNSMSAVETWKTFPSVTLR